MSTSRFCRIWKRIENKKKSGALSPGISSQIESERGENDIPLVAAVPNRALFPGSFKIRWDIAQKVIASCAILPVVRPGDLEHIYRAAVGAESIYLRPDVFGTRAAEQRAAHTDTAVDLTAAAVAKFFHPCTSQSANSVASE